MNICLFASIVCLLFITGMDTHQVIFALNDRLYSAGYEASPEKTTVSESDHKQPNCNSDETYKSCSNSLSPTCLNPEPKISQKCVSGCYCKDGRVKSMKLEKCIKPKDCP